MFRLNSVQLLPSLAVALALAAAPAAAQQQVMFRMGAVNEPQKIDTIVVSVRAITTDTSKGQQTVQVTPNQAAQIKSGQVVALWRDTTAAPQNNAHSDTMTVAVENIAIVKPGELVRVISRQAADLEPGQVVLFREDKPKAAAEPSGGQVLTGGQLRIQMGGDGGIQLVPASPASQDPPAPKPEADSSATKKDGNTKQGTP